MFVGNVVWFSGFTWFNMGRITKNDRCLIKTIKTENITHKRNFDYDVIVSSQSIAVNKQTRME